ESGARGSGRGSHLLRRRKKHAVRPLAAEGDEGARGSEFGGGTVAYRRRLAEEGRKNLAAAPSSEKEGDSATKKVRSVAGGISRGFRFPCCGGKDSGSIRVESEKFRCKNRTFQQVGRLLELSPESGHESPAARELAREEGLNCKVWKVQ
ncbi:hypothetical protein LINGRAHAP2_LOCUS5163, partial [Linum grandiflorum]